jgi:predicted DNA binding CopG/RHH family protein
VHLVKVVDLVGNDAKNSLSNMIVNLEASTKEETIEVSATQKFVDLLNPLNWQLK